MTVVEQRGTRTGRRLALWAWVAVALAPFGLVLGVVVAFLGGESTAPAALGALPALLSLAAPTAAVILSVGAARAGNRSGRIAVVVSLALLLVILVLLPILVIGMAGWVIALAVVIAVLLLFDHRSRRAEHKAA